MSDLVSLSHRQPIQPTSLDPTLDPTSQSNLLDWPTLDPTSANIRSILSLSPPANPTNFIGSNQPIQLVGLANVGSNLSQCHLTVSHHQPIQPTLLDPTLDPISQSNILGWPMLDPTSISHLTDSLSSPTNPDQLYWMLPWIKEICWRGSMLGLSNVVSTNPCI